MTEYILGTMAKIADVQVVREAEDLGYTHMGAGEGPLLFSEPYQYLAIAALQTQRIALGTWVTNPITRLAPQTANAVATLAAVAPGRTFLGIGAANNAMRSMGMRPARLGEIEECVRVVRALLRGEQVDYCFEGKTRPIALLDPDSGWYRIDQPIPIYLAAGGPKSLALGGRISDGVVCAVGPNTDLIRLVRRQLDDASEAAGRERGSVKLIASTFFYLLRPGEGIEDAIANGFGSGPLVSCVVNRRIVADNADELDPEFAAAVEHGARAYIGYGGETSPTAHLSAWRNYMRGLDQRHLERIAPPVVDGFAIWGTPEECRAKARAMLDAGADVLNLFLSNPATLRRDMTDFSQVVIASL